MSDPDLQSGQSTAPEMMSPPWYINKIGPQVCRGGCGRWALSETYLCAKHLRYNSNEFNRWIDKVLAPRLAAKDLTYLWLGGMDFSGQDLRNVSFVNSFLSHANFDGALLNEADLSHACLAFATFKGAYLDHTRFVNCNLTRSSFVEPKLLSNCNFEHSQAISADFQDAYLKNCLFRGADLHASSIKRCYFDKSDLTDTRLSHANLRLVGFRACTLDSTNFDFSSCTTIDLTESLSLKKASFENASIEFPLFLSADLQDRVQALENRGICVTCPVPVLPKLIPRDLHKAIDAISVLTAANETSSTEERLHPIAIGIQEIERHAALVLRGDNAQRRAVDWFLGEQTDLPVAGSTVGLALSYPVCAAVGSAAVSWAVPLAGFLLGGVGFEAVRHIAQRRRNKHADYLLTQFAPDEGESTHREDILEVLSE